MFYESIGMLLGGAAESLAAGADDASGDEREARRRRQITTLVRRLGAVWPDLFAALAEETAILETTLAGALQAARANELPVPPSAGGAAPSDPLERYRAVMRELDELLIGFHAREEETWAGEAVRRVRRGLADAAEVQGRIVDAMLAA